MSSKMRRKRERGDSYFDWLSDDEVLYIINKLPNLETLIRLSAVCNRFSSLVSKIDSITIARVDLSASPPRSKHGAPLKFFTDLVFGEPVANRGFAFKTICKKFQEIKHLRVEIDSSKECKAACFGSHSDVLMYLHAVSVKQSDSFSSDVKFVDQTMDIFRLESSDSFTTYLKCVLRLSAGWHDVVVQNLIQEFPNLRTFVLFDSLNVIFVLGEEQLARLRNNSNNLKDNTTNAANVRAIYVPIWELKSCGVIMENVILTVFTNEKIELNSELKLVDGVGNPDNDWRFSREAIGEIVDKIKKNGLTVKKILYVSDFINC
ncbi:uncharacterized protein LOC126686707 isoform X2 [Mercurialis annua]|uniref:uncharacterized protein LOC126686707 isoform X1 n=1 Tax=Mercurialis annua TaxID=3986 RepID=UPI002160551B|nr:uncharacterized protein LOC126686707 isoform X1 [Mercurialis annua]XP_050236853.1 uncharacterized protein LOC126686707 isoform X2 [Mercurialis annua]